MTIWRRTKRKVIRAWNRFKIWAYGILVFLGLVVAVPIIAGPIHIEWTNSSTRTDGSIFDPATEQAEIRIYCNGDTNPTFTSQGAAEALDDIIAPGTYNCYGTTVDTDGVESFASEGFTKIVEKAPPNPPTF